MPGTAQTIEFLIFTLSSADPRDARSALQGLVESAAAVDSPGDRSSQYWRAALGQAVPAVVQCLAAGDPDVRRDAAEALGLIGKPPFVPDHYAQAHVVPALARALRDDAPDVRGTAAAFLGHFGPLASEAVPAVVALLSDDDIQVRATALECLRYVCEQRHNEFQSMMLDADEPRPVDEWAACLRRVCAPQARTPGQAAEWLRVLAAGSAAGLAASDDPEIRRAVAACFMQIGVQTTPWAGVAVKLCDDPSPRVRVAALTALRQLWDPRLYDRIDDLHELLTRGPEDHRLAAVSAVPLVPLPEVRACLREAARDRDPEVAVQAQRNLEHLNERYQAPTLDEDIAWAASVLSAPSLQSEWRAHVSVAHMSLVLAPPLACVMALPPAACEAVFSFFDRGIQMAWSNGYREFLALAEGIEGRAPSEGEIEELARSLCFHLMAYQVARQRDYARRWQALPSMAKQAEYMSALVFRLAQEHARRTLT